MTVDQGTWYNFPTIPEVPRVEARTPSLAWLSLTSEWASLIRSQEVMRRYPADTRNIRQIDGHKPSPAMSIDVRAKRVARRTKIELIPVGAIEQELFL